MAGITPPPGGGGGGGSLEPSEIVVSRTNTTQTIPNGAGASIEWEDTDVLVGADLELFGTTQIKVLTAGCYAISGEVDFVANATGRRGVGILLAGDVNHPGAGTLWVAPPSTGPCVLDVSLTRWLPANALVTLSAIQTSGGDLGMDWGVLCVARIA